MDDTTWNDTLERLAKSLGEQSAGYKWMHERSARYYLNVDRWLGIVLIMITGLTGTNIFISLTYNNSPITISQIIEGIILYIATVIGVIKQQLNSYENADERTSIATKYGYIYLDIKQNLALSKNNRPDAIQYIQKMNEKYNELIEYAPNIKQWIIDDFIEKYGKDPISMPDITGRIDDIIIHNSDRSDSQSTDNTISKECVLSLEETNSDVKISRISTIDKYQIDRFMENEQLK